jgi:hypothetical protein
MTQRTPNNFAPLLRLRRPLGWIHEEDAMSGITGFGWFIIITVILFLLSAIRLFGVGATVFGVTALILFFFLRH